MVTNKSAALREEEFQNIIHAVERVDVSLCLWDVRIAESTRGKTYFRCRRCPERSRVRSRRFWLVRRLRWVCSGIVSRGGRAMLLGGFAGDRRMLDVHAYVRRSRAGFADTWGGDQFNSYRQ